MKSHSHHASSGGALARLARFGGTPQVDRMSLLGAVAQEDWLSSNWLGLIILEPPPLVDDD